MPNRPASLPGMDGVLVVAKPAGPTSHDVVALARRLTGQRRIGHGGTLDPFASGVLPLFLGHATRLVEYHLGDDKTYRATFCFGASSSTDDLDGELTPTPRPDGREPVSRRELEAVLAAMNGEQLQRPPAYSAIQVGGRRAYDMARAGEATDLAARRVVIHEATLEEWIADDPDRPIAIVLIRCSAGTYVRAIARDAGERLGTAAYLGALARLASGPFTLEKATSLERLRESAAVGPEAVRALFLPADAGLEAIPSVPLSDDEVADAAKGRYVRPAAGVSAAADGETVRLVDASGAIVGMGRREGPRIAPSKMFAA
jgi:tRNA pseudouridine55 synthase